MCIVVLLTSPTCRNYVCCVEKFLDSENSVYIILTHVRAIYESKMNEPDFSLVSVSIGGTLADTITEVHALERGLPRVQSLYNYKYQVPKHNRLKINTHTPKKLANRQ